LILESFSQNPLSQFPLNEGFKKQAETLDWIVKIVQNSHPKAAILFSSTVSPNRNRFGEGTVNLTPEQRHQWADERTAYIKNHIKYAKDHNFPIADVYRQSLNKEGTGNIDYIDTHDFIHPSTSGVFLISQVLANAIVKYRLLPL
jgi:hypothetical protein